MPRRTRMNRRTKSRGSRRMRRTRANRRIGGQGAGPLVKTTDRICANCGGPAYTRAGGLTNYSCPTCRIYFSISYQGAGMGADPREVQEMNELFPKK